MLRQRYEPPTRMPWVAPTNTAIARTEREATLPGPMVAYLAAHDREQYWRARGEQAIRAEMDAAIARAQQRRQPRRSA